MLAGASFAHATVSATVTIASQQLGPNSYRYFYTFTNTGTTAIESMWMGWVPGYDLLASHPTSVTGPTNWDGADAPDYYEFFGVGSAQYVAKPGFSLAPQQTLGGFHF